MTGAERVFHNIVRNFFAAQGGEGVTQVSWFVIFVLVGRESLIARYLRSVPGIMTVLTPFAHRLEVTPGGAVAVRTENLYPGYIFFQAAGMTAEIFQGVMRLWHLGVRRVFLTPVPEEEMARVAEHLQPEVLVAAGARPAASGQPVLNTAAVREAAVDQEKVAQVDPAARAARIARVVIENLGIKRRKAAAIVRRFTRTFFVPVASLSRLLSSSALSPLLEWFSLVDTS